ncbi:MAG: BolA family protein [Pseudomonadota bacterium]
MSVQNAIECKIRDAIAPQHLEIRNESHMHAVPPGSESHFKLIIVSEGFAGKALVRRHQSINALLSEELNGPIHALSMETLTPEEWQARSGQTLTSPDCRGGSKKG